jgi:hypothetical protein
MNLHNIVGPIVAAVNPYVLASYQRSIGSTTNPDGSRVPKFTDPVIVQVQMQALTYKDLIQLDGINLNGEKHAMYISGKWEGVSRPESKGGDIITLEDGTVLMVVQILENWFTSDGWVKVAVTQQTS